VVSGAADHRDEDVLEMGMRFWLDKAEAKLNIPDKGPAPQAISVVC